jgi:hypothetical protein
MTPKSDVGKSALVGYLRSEIARRGNYLDGEQMV